MFGRRKQSDYSSAWSEVDHRNDAAKATLKALARRANWWRPVFVSCLVLSVLAFILAVGAASASQKADSQISQISSASHTERPGMQAALQAVRKWLSNKESNPYPGGIAGLQWTGATKVGSQTDSQDKATTDFWSHRFAFTDTASGRTRQVAQLVAVTNGSQESIGVPSILPPEPARGSGGASTAPVGYPTLQQSDALSKLVTQWAKAYTGDDDDALTVLVGDPNTNHLYKAANLGTFQTVAISWSVWAGDGTGAKPQQGTGYGAVSVLISFLPDGAENSSNVNTSLTLLIDNPAGGAPKVVAWGADGDIKGLRPHGNAVDKAQTRGDQARKDPSDTTSPSTPADKTGIPTTREES